MSQAYSGRQIVKHVFRVRISVSVRIGNKQARLRTVRYTGRRWNPLQILSLTAVNILPRNTTHRLVLLDVSRFTPLGAAVNLGRKPRPIVRREGP